MKKDAKAIWAAIKMAHSFDKYIMPARAVQALLDAAVPFIAVLLSAFVLDQLTKGSAFASIFWPVMAGVAAVFVMRMVSGRLDQYQNSRWMVCYYKWANLVGEKTLELDYPQLEDPEIAALQQKMRRDQNWGSGIGNTYGLFYDLLNKFFNLIFALILLGPMIIQPIFYRNWGTLGFLALAVLCAGGTLLFSLTVYKKGMHEFTSHDWRKTKFSRYGARELDYHFGKDVRIYGVQGLLKHYACAPEYMRYFTRLWSRAARVQGWHTGLDGLSEALIQGGAYLFTALIALAGNLSIGLVVRSASGLFQLTQNISGLLNTWSEFSVDTLRLRSQFEYLSLPGTLYKGTLTTEKRTDNQYEIEFRDVSFQYPGSKEYALRHLNLKLTVGRRLAVVGMNGSGKTTMIKLLCRLYDPTSGVITLNGIDIKQYDYQEYMGIFSVVFQDYRLFGFPLGENVAMSIEVDQARAADCLERAGFGGRLSEMPQGLDTFLYKDYDSSGVDISGGEAQKVALARALYKDAAFVVLDEPTAALDPLAEFEIYSRFDGIVGDKTAVYISHRLSSCRFCHDIAVFHEGELIQRGSHEELLADEQGKYYELWHAQAQYYTQENNQEEEAVC